MRWQTVVVAMCVLALGACGSGDDDDSGATSSTATTVTTYGGVPGAAQEIACKQDVRTWQQAADLYGAQHGSKAPSLDAIVAEGDVDGPPGNDHGYVIGYDAATGTITATGACTAP